MGRRQTVKLEFCEAGSLTEFRVDDWFNDESLSVRIGSAYPRYGHHVAALGQPKAIHSKVTRDYSERLTYSLFEHDCRLLVLKASTIREGDFKWRFSGF